VFLFLGRIRRYKGVQELLDAFRTLDREDIRLVVAGRLDSPALGKALRQRVREDRRVVLRAGTVPDDRMQVFLRAADVMVRRTGMCSPRDRRSWA